jgi:hypothetical protein
MMPFEIAPKLKINNYLDQPFKQIAPSIKTPSDKESMPFSVSPATTGSKFDKSSGPASGANYKVSGFDE